VQRIPELEKRMIDWHLRNERVEELEGQFRAIVSTQNSNALQNGALGALL
jgi:hypothetical protein